MTRILYIEANRDGTIGGSYYSLLYLLQGLNQAKYEPHVMFCQDNVLIPEFRKITPHIYINDFGPSLNGIARSWGDLLKWPYRFIDEIVLRQWTLSKIIRETQPDLVHLNNGYAAMHEWVVACALHGIKVIVHDRGTPAPSSMRTRLIVRFIDAIISVSDSFKRNVTSQGLRVKRAVRVYNGLSPELLQTRIGTYEGKLDLKKELEISSSQPVVGILGNVDRWKGQLVVIEAIEQVKHVYPNIKCLIVGKVPRGAESYEQEIKDYISLHNLQANVVLVGFRNDIQRVLDVLDVMLHASIQPEPFGRVILEGMAAGKPIVATNSGGTPEQIVHGETGLLVPMGDAGQMAEAILYYLSNEKRAKEMGEKGRKRLLDLFSIQSMVDGVEKVYEEVLNS